MGFFDKKQDKVKANEPSVVEESAPMSEADKAREALLPVALEREKAIREKQDEVLSIYRDDDIQQFAGFFFSCVRHGDFLTMFMTRSVNDSYEDYPSETKMTETINLGLVRSISEYVGRSPDTEGRVSHFTYLRNPCESVGFLNDNPEPQPKNLVSDSHFLKPEPRPFVGDGSLRHQYFTRNDLWSDRHPLQIHVTDNIPRPSEDDRISFKGIDLSILVPHGKMDMVREIIMKAIGDGYTLNVTRDAG